MTMNKTTDKKLLNKIRKWCEKPGKSRALLAHRLGFQHTTTIQNWFTFGKIPRMHKERLEKELAS